MTVHEPRHGAGLPADFGAAAAARDKDRLRTLLTAAPLSEPGIKGVIHTIPDYRSWLF